MTETDDAPDPTPLAVALRQDPSANNYPRVTATGRGAVAEQILAIAFAHDVKVRTDADLVAVLGALDLDSPIPPVVLATVAEILTYVYRANGHIPDLPFWPADGREGAP